MYSATYRCHVGEEGDYSQSKVGLSIDFVGPLHAVAIINCEFDAEEPRRGTPEYRDEEKCAGDVIGAINFVGGDGLGPEGLMSPSHLPSSTLQPHINPE